MTTVAKINPIPFATNYASMSANGVDQKELVTLSRQAVEDHKLDDKEKAAFGEIYASHVQGQGEYSEVELMELPPQVQNLFQDMRAARRPEIPKAISPFKIMADGPQSLQDANLSPARREMRNQLDQVVSTSRWGYTPSDEEAAAGKRNLFENMTAMSSGTTCGLLPGSMLRHMGVLQAGIAGNATNGIETEGNRLGVWVESDGKALPQPGDIYALRYEDAPNTPNSVAHVGVIYATSAGQFTTADAGQGTREKQEAKLVQRNLIFDVRNRPYLSGPDNVPGDSASFRRIAGWVDTDRMMFLQTYQDMAIGLPGEKPKGGEVTPVDLARLTVLATRDKHLNPTEVQVFTEIAHHRGKISDEDIQRLPKEIQAIFEAAAHQPAPKLIALPSDVPDNVDKPKSWRRRSTPIAGTGAAADHS